MQINTRDCAMEKGGFQRSSGDAFKCQQHKKDDEQREINYRPITVLQCVDKVYEVLLWQQVSRFMDDRLSDAITAYGAKISCETTLIRLTATWRVELDSKKVVGVLLLDMCKAFDSLSPQLSINKLLA